MIVDWGLKEEGRSLRQGEGRKGNKLRRFVKLRNLGIVGRRKMQEKE